MAHSGGLPRAAPPHDVRWQPHAACLSGDAGRGRSRARLRPSADDRRRWLWVLCPPFRAEAHDQRPQRRITIALPDALDLTVICVEVGLALDQALMRVGEDLKYSHPDLSDEFYLVNLEMRAGKPRAEALRNLSDRTGVDDVRALVTTLIQTDRFSTSIATALRMHSETLRTERRQRAEEQAAKTTIKMVVPLAVFILPSIIFVTLGPAMIQLFRQLSQGR